MLRGDTLLAERYFGKFSSASRHIVMSISKSFAGMLAGVLAATDLLDLEATVPTYVPELAAGSYAGATVAQLLDMTAAPHYDMSYLKPTAEVHAGDRAAGWRPRQPADVVGTRPFLAQLRGPAGTAPTSSTARGPPTSSRGSSNGPAARATAS